MFHSCSLTQRDMRLKNRPKSRSTTTKNVRVTRLQYASICVTKSREINTAYALVLKVHNLWNIRTLASRRKTSVSFLYSFIAFKPSNVPERPLSLSLSLSLSAIYTVTSTMRCSGNDNWYGVVK